MENERRVSSDFLQKHKEEFDNLFRDYLDEINANIIQYEVIANEAPVAILNEIRAIMSHLARISISEDESVAIENIEKIKGHSTRAKLDGYKYMCMAIAKRRISFFDQYNGIEFSRINNGEFIVQMNNANEKAEERLIKAKTYESENGPDENLYNLYAEAYLEYKNVYDLVKVGEKYAPQLKKNFEEQKKEEQLQQEMSQKSLLYGKRGYTVGIIGMIVGVIGIIVGIVL